MEIEKNLKGFKEEMVQFRENEHFKVVERLTALEKKFTQMKSKAGNAEKEVSNQGTSRLNDEEADAMHEKVSNLELLIQSLREDVTAAFRDVHDRINNEKGGIIDNSLLLDLEQQLFDRMQKMIGELKFADRGETKKALKELNR